MSLIHSEQGTSKDSSMTLCLTGIRHGVYPETDMPSYL